MLSNSTLTLYFLLKKSTGGFTRRGTRLWFIYFCINAILILAVIFCLPYNELNPEIVRYKTAETYSNVSLLQCNAVWSGISLSTFRKNMLPLSSLFYPEDGCTRFLRNFPDDCLVLQKKIVSFINGRPFTSTDELDS
jgi:hypothetical protein